MKVRLVEVIQGVYLTLRARGNNIEKLFTILSGANPDPSGYV
jgi:hypothetical protein